MTEEELQDLELQSSHKRAQRTMREALPHFVYEMYDRKGRPLYVGATVQVAKRLATHSVKYWWAHVDRIVMNAYPDRMTAHIAELRLIHDLEPLHNIQGIPTETLEARQGAEA